MTDIVERLRQRAGDERNIRYGRAEEALMLEAADKVAELRDLLREFIDILDAVDGDC